MLGPLVRELDPDVDMIMFDLPGIGGSSPPRGPYRVTGLCRLIAGMLTGLGYDRVDVLGISWGGGVAQHFAAFWRSRCRRLVLAATATGSLMVPARPSVLVHLVMQPRRQMDRAYLYRVVGGVFGGSARSLPERVAAAMSDGDWLGSALGYLYQLVAAAGWTSVPFLPAIRQPTLIVAGDDPIIPLVNARLMNLLIPRSRLHAYHGGHLGLATEATELAPVVDAFLATP
jgi:poly(3-hydroxyalkanoate) depolymerase